MKKESIFISFIKGGIKFFVGLFIFFLLWYFLGRVLRNFLK